ncbi:hypothetical protein LTR78_008996 [Recurvomyces mirabilis]|uniref:PPPDE domain-containing protein n=1 Tax=Recurvomyces mirabilis TaxID=574656 RepID=A0AAE0TQ77_9PEZI|nr:hypothetical protein LTR78_008996 [Recurvomyces mirabilis]KAK5159796.1 hypothetical protein LTS14_001901 [Recurvomyces mirabilis]
MSTNPPRSKRSRTSSSISQRASRTIGKTEITINVYDLLPPSRLSSLLWTLGSGLLHTGVVIHDREYAYGGHNRRNTTGVYHTPPGHEPPGGTFRCSILQGISFLPIHEIDSIIHRVSEEFLGEKYNLLTNNCNHFTSTLCSRLTGKPAPGWVNRAAGIGLAIPCMVPKEWIQPPDHETAEGELIDGDEEDEDEDEDEQAAMLDSDRRRTRRAEEEQRQRRSAAGGSGRRAAGGSRSAASSRNTLDSYDTGTKGSSLSLVGGRRISWVEGTPPPRLVSVGDTSGREMPVAERAPVPVRR